MNMNMFKKLINDDLLVNWHPYTQMKDHEKYPPILIKSAKGIKLYDFFGKWYYDTISSWWCNLHGHNHPHIQKAIKDQIKKVDHVMFAGFTHETAINLSKKLLLVSPKNLSRVFYSDNGSTAVETALKMAIQYWFNNGIKQKNTFVAFDLAYHGDTFGAMSVGGISTFTRPFSPLFFKTYKVLTPYCYRCPCKKNAESCSIECIKPLQHILEKYSEKIAAFIFEPLLLGAAGMIIYPSKYLRLAQELCKKYNVLMIADEVATGFGRTGKMFACDHADLKPDFLCLSKGLTNGVIAFAATLTTEKIYNAFYSDFVKQKTFYHGHTFTANPIACAIANANLEIFEKENTLCNVEKITNTFRSELPKFKALPFIGDIRSIGTILAFEIVENKNSKKPFSFEKRIGFKIYQEGLKKNLILRPIGNVIYLFLPLSTKMPELFDILEKTYNVLKKIELYK